MRGLTATILVLGIWVPTTALAEEDDAALTPFELVDQALQVLRDTPEDLTRVMELIRAALEIEAGRPTGTVRNLELQSAIVAIRRGDVREAELRLASALGPDPHAQHHDPLASAPPEPEQESLPAVPPTVRPEASAPSTAVLTLGGPDDEASGAGWAQALGYVIVAVGTVVLGRAAVAERRRSRA